MWPAVAGSAGTSVSLPPARTPLLNGSAGSVEAFNASVPGLEDDVADGLPLGTARLGLRNRPPNFDDFLPSPSVPSASDVASGLRSFLVPRALKNDERRAGFVLSGAAEVAVESRTGAEGSDVAAGVAVVSAEVSTGSSIWGAVDEVTALSGSLAGTAGAVSVEGLTGLVVSFLLKKLPKMELLLLDLGADSRMPFPVAGSVGDVVAGSTGELVAVVVPAAAVSPSVSPVVSFAESPEATAGSTGDPITRAAKNISFGRKQ